MEQICSIESAIYQQLTLIGTCSLDELVGLLPGYSWVQVFSAVDRMTREGVVILKHPTPLLYSISLAPHEPVEAGHIMQS